ncbi:MAG: hypothetical protein H7Y01_14730, partial [Ferruginibacter sp.]|nr:hypothetical protein [Chitinophagaceae bacterium]
MNTYFPAVAWYSKNWLGFMKRKFYPRLLYSCFIILLNEECAHAQLLASRNNKVYTDYKKEHKELLFDEQFNSNEGHWPAEAKIYDGILT